MKIELELRELKKLEMYLFQPGFTLQNDKKEIVIEFNTVVPGGFPYIFVKSGKNKGKNYIIDEKELQKLCTKLIE